jgi:RES domain-containing protein
MTVTAWRIVTACHVQNAFDGEGARLYGGRWNPPGIAVVYTAGSLSLAALEMLAGLNSMQLLSLFTGIPVTIESRHIQSIPALPDGWDIIPAGSVSRKTGADWIQSADSPVLEVPSVIIPSEKNYLLNPAHPDFKHLKIGDPRDFTFDTRLLKKGR